MTTFLKAKQEFPEQLFDKIPVKFTNKMDMMVMCLSLFVHDFAHDFNFSGMYTRILKKNEALFKSLGFKIGNSIVKKWVIKDAASRGYFGYDDKSFQDEPNNEKLQEIPALAKFDEKMQSYETQISSSGGAVPPGENIQAQMSPYEEGKLKLQVIVTPTNPKDVLLNDPVYLHYFSVFLIYVINFLNSDKLFNGYKEAFNLIKNDKQKTYNLMIHNSILCSLDRIIESFRSEDYDDEDDEENLENIEIIRSYSYLFKLLKDAYIKVFNSDFSQDPFNILNSPELLQQYTESFVLFLQNGSPLIGGTTDSDIPFLERDTSEDTTDSSVVTESSSGDTSYLLTDIIGITHNNLLTTIARGIFLKLNIWQTVVGEHEPFIFKNVAKITFQQLNTVYPIEVSKNNQLLIIEILILKCLLLEISPFQSFKVGTNVDNYLKDYMDSFYNEYFIKEQKEQSRQESEKESEIDTNLLKFINSFNNDDFEEEEENDDNFDEGQEGGTNDIETVEGKVELHPELDELLKSIERYKKPSYFPILLESLQENYELNEMTITNLINSKINPINIIISDEESLEISNLFQLLALNLSVVKSPKGILFLASKYKFIINNAGRINSNINGMKFIVAESNKYTFLLAIEELKLELRGQQGLEIQQELQEELTALEVELKEITDKEYKLLLNNRKSQLKNKLFLLKEKSQYTDDEFIIILEKLKKDAEKWTLRSSKFLGVYQSLNRGVFCPTTSIIDSMDNCSYKNNPSEPQEFGCLNFELFHSEGEQQTISFGGHVLNYFQSIKRDQVEPNGPEEIRALIDFTLFTGDPEDEVHIFVPNITVTNDISRLNSNVSYRAVIERIRSLFEEADRFASLPQLGNVLTDEELLKQQIDRLNYCWNYIQYSQIKDSFNRLLAASSVKTMGDFLQEMQGTIKWGGFISQVNEDYMQYLKQENIFDENTKLVYRSITEPGRVMPYDERGNALRLGVQGDRPSSFRSIYTLMNAELNGVNDQSITGYIFTQSTQRKSRTLLVSRNEDTINKSGLKGMVIYATPEFKEMGKIVETINRNYGTFEENSESDVKEKRKPKGKKKEKAGLENSPEILEEIPSSVAGPLPLDVYNLKIQGPLINPNLGGTKKHKHVKKHKYTKRQKRKNKKSKKRKTVIKHNKNTKKVLNKYELI
jgi:hypothetical protein